MYLVHDQQSTKTHLSRINRRIVNCLLPWRQALIWNRGVYGWREQVSRPFCWYCCSLVKKVSGWKVQEVGGNIFLFILNWLNSATGSVNFLPFSRIHLSHWRQHWLLLLRLQPQRWHEWQGEWHGSLQIPLRVQLPRSLFLLVCKLLLGDKSLGIMYWDLQQNMLVQNFWCW